ncbi:MerR family transcriptional regulator [Furfurilactobacillus sp. WILCCON 0119]|uniref:MerR family transcriptional regulator n=1 Tax=Furfurilactobacillus entadae TaxID=2922307 RepID=UPI0035EEC92A
MATYSISEAAAFFDLPESTLRYYDKRGLLTFLERDDFGNRVFTETQMALLATITHLKNSDMSIQQIKQYVDWIMEGDVTIPKRLEMMKAHRKAIEQQIAAREASLDQVDYKIARYQKYVDEQEQVKS